MKEYPIIFKGWKIPKIMDGSATMTRRPLKPQPDDDAKITVSKGIAYIGNSTSGGLVTRMPCPYGVLGDHLWVRETYLLHNQRNIVWYKADGDPPGGDWDNRWQPSIFMSRKYSRTTLEITNIKVERVQEITEEDIVKEGIRKQEGRKGANWPLGEFGYRSSITGYFHAPLERNKTHCCCDEGRRLNLDTWKCAYREIWDDLYSKGAWERNDWVWAIEYKRINYDKTVNRRLRMSTQRKVKEYVADCLTESKTSMKSIRERRLRDRKAYKGKKLKYKDVSRRSD